MGNPTAGKEPGSPPCRLYGVCHNLIEGLGGRIQVFSRAGEGSEIQVILPPQPEATAPTKTAASDRPAA